MKKLGYADEQIPDWVAAEAAQAEAAKAAQAAQATQAAQAAHPAQAEQPTLPEAAEPLNPPLRTGRARKIGAALLGQGSSAGAALLGQGSSAQGMQGQGMQPSQTAGEAAFEGANKMLGPGGQRIEALGSDNLQSWMQEGGIEERDGFYWQRQRLPTGQTALVQLQSPKDLVEAEEFCNA